MKERTTQITDVMSPCRLLPWTSRDRLSHLCSPHVPAATLRHIKSGNFNGWRHRENVIRQQLTHLVWCPGNTYICAYYVNVYIHTDTPTHQHKESSLMTLKRRFSQNANTKIGLALISHRSRPFIMSVIRYWIPKSSCQHAIWCAIAETDCIAANACVLSTH